MSGHSKWDTIKHDKAIKDAKKGKVFSKLAQLISVSVRDGGEDISANIGLRLLVDKARSVSMPLANIERAIERGTGKGEDKLVIEAGVYEGFGPASSAVVIDVLTDNRNRVVAELRQIFNDNGGTLGESGSVLWNFEQKGRVIVECGKMVKSEKFGQPDQFTAENKDEVIMKLMDIEGIDDIRDWDEDSEEGREYLEVVCKAKDLALVRDGIIAVGYVIDSTELCWEAKMLKDVSDQEKQRVADFLSKIEENEDVQGVYTDIKF